VVDQSEACVDFNHRIVQWTASNPGFQGARRNGFISPHTRPRRTKGLRGYDVRMHAERNLRLLTAALAVALTLSGIGPKDRMTWWLEVGPIFVVMPVLWATRRRFPLTGLLYFLIGVHGAILALGGHYTYAEVPLGTWMQEWFGFTRNHYDRIGHIAQGFIPAIATREILLRCTPLNRGGWLFFLVTCVCLAVSAFYEMIEWWVAVLSDEAAEAFLGTQGDSWDTQWDMFLALLGAIAALLLLRGVHDRQLQRLPGPPD